jgi:hypothetical protein
VLSALPSAGLGSDGIPGAGWLGTGWTLHPPLSLNHSDIGIGYFGSLCGVVPWIDLMFDLAMVVMVRFLLRRFILCRFPPLRGCCFLS